MNDLSLYDTLIYATGPLILGIIMLIKGGTWAVDAAVYTAQRYGISPMIIGFTVIAFGTSLPELIVSVLSNFQGAAGIAIGNVVGSNIANILLVIGASAMFITFHVRRTTELARDLAVMLAATACLVGLALYGGIGRGAGVLMTLSLMAYVVIQCRTSSADTKFVGDTDIHCRYKSNASAYSFLLAGLLLVAVGAEYMVKGARLSAGIIGVPDAVIGLSIVALGTSLPELTTSIIASRKGHDDMVIGNIAGSNVFNILMILGFTALIKPVEQGGFPAQLVSFDIWVMLAVAVAFSALLMIYGKIGKVTGGLFLLVYLAYNIYIYAVSMGA